MLDGHEGGGTAKRGRGRVGEEMVNILEHGDVSAAGLHHDVWGTAEPQPDHHRFLGDKLFAPNLQFEIP